MTENEETKKKRGKVRKASRNITCVLSKGLSTYED